MDGKYAAVKGYEQKIPFIYGIDYLTHDIPLGALFPVEDEMAFVAFFAKLKSIGYPPRAVIADDRQGLKPALLRVFPRARLQLCHVHYLENLRRILSIRTEEKYEEFFYALRGVFRKARSEEQVLQELRFIQTKDDSMLLNILADIRNRVKLLFAFRQVQGCPNSTNMIESYNSHLQGRLKTIKGFQSFVSAKAWLNAYLIRRRTKQLTDCQFPFKHLNKHASLELTIKKQAEWPDILKKLGIKKIGYFDGPGV
jgi:transposase-like protein